jgi:hypothetical protein
MKKRFTNGISAVEASRKNEGIIDASFLCGTEA